MRNGGGESEGVPLGPFDQTTGEPTSENRPERRANRGPTERRPLFGEIAKATDWQNHSIRGFISGTLGKKMGLTVESSKNDAGERTYKLAK